MGDDAHYFVSKMNVDLSLELKAFSARIQRGEIKVDKEKSYPTWENSAKSFAAFITP